MIPATAFLSKTSRIYSNAFTRPITTCNPKWAATASDCPSPGSSSNNTEVRLDSTPSPKKEPPSISHLLCMLRRLRPRRGRFTAPIASAQRVSIPSAPGTRTSFPQRLLLHLPRFLPRVILRQLIRLPRRFRQTIALSAGHDILYARFQADAVTQGDKHGVHMRSCTQSSAQYLTFSPLNQWHPRA